MKWFIILAVAVVSASAFFAQPQQRAQTNAAAATNAGAMGTQRLPDMNLVMQLVRQILMLLLPKLLANPSLMTALSGGNGNGGGGGGGFYPQPPMGGGGFMPAGDKFKDMRIVELLQSPGLALRNDPMVARFIPPGPVPLGWSLPDVAKDHIMYAMQRRVRMRGGQPSREEQELMALIGDMPMMG